MRLPILYGVFASAFAAHLGHIQPSPGIAKDEGSCDPSCSLNRRLRKSMNQMAYVSSKQIGGFLGFKECGGGKVLHFDGSCVLPIITRNIFYFTAPQQQFQDGTSPAIPQPKIDHNIVFVRTPETHGDRKPVVVPPPQQKTIIYVLNRNGIHGEQKVIEIPSVSHSPEVYYVNFNEGDNPILSGGIDLQSALASATKNAGQFIEGSPIGLEPPITGGFAPSAFILDPKFNTDPRPGGKKV